MTCAAATTARRTSTAAPTSPYTERPWLASYPDGVPADYDFWVAVVETLTRMRVEEWIELGGGGVLTRMLRDFELPSLKGVTSEDLRARLSQQAQNLLPRKDEGE